MELLIMFSPSTSLPPLRKTHFKPRMFEGLLCSRPPVKEGALKRHLSFIHSVNVWENGAPKELGD